MGRLSDLKFHKRLAASIMRCGKRKVWIDPGEVQEISNGSTRHNIRRLIKDGMIIKKPPIIHSRSRARQNKAARLKGKHNGPGKRRGTEKARNNPKILWVHRMQVLRRLLKKYRKNKKIDKHFYRSLYYNVKGNAFKNKRVLIEHINKTLFNKKRAEQAAQQAEARRERVRQSRERRVERINMKKSKLLAKLAEESEQQAES